MRWIVGIAKSAPISLKGNENCGRHAREPASGALARPHTGRREMKESIDRLHVSITKRFGGKTVLDKLFLDIRGREFVTFLGPSGCGKSTALGIIAGLVPASEGEI